MGGPMRLVNTLLMAALFGAAANATAIEYVPTSVVGEAFSLKDGELRYREVHQCSTTGDRCTVEYQSPDGQLIARKELDYQDSLHSPSLQVQDLRQGQTLTVEGDKQQEVVVDAGFDHYVRLRWEELTGGETVRFPFLVVGRDKPLKMAATQAEGCPNDRTCFSVNLDNWLLGNLLTPIHLEYDSRSRRLLQFRGVSNIRDEQGRSQQVRIDYRYAPAAGGSTS